MTDSCPQSVTKAPLSPELLSACIHCGLCLPACPTYLATGKETESPRGRIHLLNLVQKEELAPTPDVLEHLDSCLGCLGCQTACPSGVQYGHILDEARALSAQHRDRKTRKMMRFIFAKILPDYKKLHGLGKLIRLWQQLGMAKFMQTSPAMRRAFGRLAQWQRFLPKVPPHKALPRQSWAPGEKLGPVQLFHGCVMDIFYNHVNHAAIRLLTLQRRVVQVPEQTCCGALAFHAGEVDIAKRQARANIELLEQTQGEIAVTAAGCGAMLKGYGELLHNDPVWSERATAFSARVKDATEILAEGKFTKTAKSAEHKVAYHAACHLSHAQGVRNAPVELLGGIDGIKMVPLEESEHCCGSAGIFNLTHTELSEKILARKMSFLKESGADSVVTTNPGCLLQIDAGMKTSGVQLKNVHLLEMLDDIYSER